MRGSHMEPWSQGYALPSCKPSCPSSRSSPVASAVSRQTLPRARSQGSSRAGNTAKRLPLTRAVNAWLRLTPSDRSGLPARITSPSPRFRARMLPPGWA